MKKRYVSYLAAALSFTCLFCDKYFVLTHCLHNDKYYGRLAKKISSTHTTGKMKEIKKMNNITF